MTLATLLAALLLMAKTCELVGGKYDMYRLPDDIRPLRYGLDMFVDNNKDICKGNVVIHMLCVYPTNVIRFHARDIDFNKTSMVVRTGNRHIKIVGHNYMSPAVEMYEIKIQKPCRRNHRMMLSIFRFGCIINSKYGRLGSRSETTGLFYGTRKQDVVATQFQPTSARRVFPCFDEPRWKTSFELSIMHPSDTFALSNMPVRKTLISRTYASTSFKSSDNLPTYLVAFAVMNKSSSSVEFGGEYRGGSIKSYYQGYRQPSPLNVYGIKNALSHLERVTQFKYYWPKTDFVALEQYDAGGMENPGLIMMTAQVFPIFDDVLPQTDYGMFATQLIAHELAHQWFGDAVTCEWWEDIWLNEGVTSYFTTLAMFGFRDEDVMQDSFHTKMSGIILDDERNSRPLSKPVRTPKEIMSTLKDTTYTYSKGAAMTRFIRITVGDRIFFKAIKHYLHLYNKKSVTVAKFLRSFKKLGIHTNHYMPWINESGCPLIRVSMREHGLVNMTQEPSNPQTSSTEMWPIPMIWKTDMYSSVVPSEWFNTKHMQIAVPTPMKWFIFNTDRVLPLRVDYDEKLWDHIVAILHENHKIIPLGSRIQLMDDAIHLKSNGKSRMSDRTFLHLLRYLKSEREYGPWYTFVNYARRIWSASILPVLADILPSTYKYVRDIPSERRTLSDNKLHQICSIWMRMMCRKKLPTMQAECQSLGFKVASSFKDKRSNYVYELEKPTAENGKIPVDCINGCTNEYYRLSMSTKRNLISRGEAIAIKDKRERAIHNYLKNSKFLTVMEEYYSRR